VHVTGGTGFGSGAFQTVVVGLDGRRPEPPRPLPLPATSIEIAAAETGFGFPLPEDLKQLCSEVANGGFGPSGGPASLEEIAERYGQLTADAPGEGGQAWPRQLLPIGLSAPGVDCYGLGSGHIVYWDEESLAAGPDDRIWERWFKNQADGLAAWLEAWLACPAAADLVSQAADEAGLAHLRTALPVLRAMTAGEREAVGITGDDWEESLCRRFGVDPADL
jgi:hypothetical protein